jgi:hypothetical protein
VAFAAAFHADLVVTDGRRGLRSEVVGREALVGGLAGTYEEHEIDLDLEIVASRDRAGIVRMSVHGEVDDAGGAFESDRLTVYEMSADTDVISRVQFLDADAHNAAYALLHEWSGQTGDVRAAPGVDPTHKAFFSQVRTALAGHDWESLRELFHSDYVVTDARSGLRSEVVGRDNFVKALRDTYKGRRVDAHLEILANRGRAGLINWLTFGPGDTISGPWESPRLGVYELDDEDRVLARMQFFDAEARESAYALLHEWAGRTGGVRAAPSVAPTHVVFWQHFREALVDKDWETFASLWHAEAIYADRRPGLQSEVVGGAEASRVLRESFATREFDYDIEIIASRGNAGIFLSRFFGLGDALGGPFEAERLIYYELDRGGLIVLGELYEPSEREALLAKLDALAAQPVRGAASVDADHMSAWRRFREAIVVKDWNGVASVWSHDGVQAPVRSVRSQRDSTVLKRELRNACSR